MPTRSCSARRGIVFSKVFAVGALMCMSAVARAQDPLLDQAAEQMRQHDPAAAYAGLAAVESQRAGDPRYDYLLGVAALDSGHLTRAIFALERVMAVEPGNALARAELARAYLAAGETDSARAELEQVRHTDLPKDVAAAIDRVLGVVDQVAPAPGVRLSGYLELGGGYDSNVNSAANQGEFAIPAFGGLLFSASAESQKQHDWFLSAAGGAEGQLALTPDWKLVAAANLRGNMNRTVHDMNTDLLDTTVALKHTAGVSAQTVALQSNTAWVGAGVYRTANGASAQWQTQMDAVSQASIFMQWSRQEFPGQADRNTDRSVIGLGYARDVTSVGALVFASTYLADERVRHAGFEYFGHHAAGLRLGVEKSAGDTCVLALEWQHEKRHYGGAEPLFDFGREDRQDDLTARLRWRVRDHWEVVPQFRYTRSASNVVLYDYTRSVFQLSVRREFT